MNKRTLLIIIAAALLIGCAVWAFGDFNKGDAVSYPSFLASLEAGDVSEVEIYKDRLAFRTGRDGKLYRTDNPDRDGFKEQLLLEEIKVTDHTKEDDGINYWLDMIFNLFFIGLLVFGVSRLVKLYTGTFRVVRHTGITFDRIAGMASVKKEMLQAVGFLKDPKAAAAKGIRPIKGIILEGPPGNGKTLFARALAEECGVKFIAAKGADFQSALMSMGAMKIRLLFSKARRNRPCIIFIDEFDSIGERRNYAGSGIDKENNRIITSMLNEMDGFSPTSGVLVIGATNSYTSLDPALIRAGRFDLKYHIGNPDPQTRKELIRIYTQGRRLAPDLGEGRLSDLFKDLSCAEIETILNEAAAIALADGERDIAMGDIAEAGKKVRSSKFEVQSSK